MFDHEVVVVGGGAMGAATAWQLASDGRDVALVERYAPGHTHGSSHGHTRIFRLAYRDPRYTALALDALPRWRALEEEAGEALLDQCGQLDHGAPEALDDVVAALERYDRPVERLSAADVAARWPGIRVESGAVLSPDGGFVAADRTVAALHRLAAQHGASVRCGERVVRIEPLAAGDGVRVITDAGTITAPVVVVAAGAWAAELLGGLVALPSLTVTLAIPSHFLPLVDLDGPWPSVVHYRRDDAPLAFGAYAVWAPGVGFKVGLEDAARVVDPDAPPPTPPDAVAALAAYAAEWFPGLDPRPLDPHLCLFTSTPDEHFVLDRRGPIVVVSPCSGHGFKFVPAIGRLAADLAGAPDGAAVTTDPAWRLPQPG